MVKKVEWPLGLEQKAMRTRHIHRIAASMLREYVDKQGISEWFEGRLTKEQVEQFEIEVEELARKFEKA